ncbi:hypothetical protein RA086_09810 [Lactiplantibacillus sp. WILCCON 0030]|uniref:Uncharacterized protein n=1 Tax=Lactiplantibacillus brownii TaxID=3069269 RepID=A0ABU1AAC9_9LACO|nr:hypothetical protein [Lactiplantibacillus brownii]MDQ7937902.1 hypothetical protein [Lactiplantibacillus brownii]
MALAKGNRIFANFNHILDTLETDSAKLVSTSYHQLATKGIVPTDFSKPQKSSKALTMMNGIDELDQLYAQLRNID